jgi:hypothetical protein
LRGNKALAAIRPQHTNMEYLSLLVFAGECASYAISGAAKDRTQK